MECGNPERVALRRFEIYKKCRTVQGYGKTLTTEKRFHFENLMNK